MKPPSYIKNMYNCISLNADSAEFARSEAGSVDDFYSRLAAEIVIHAIADWRELIKKKRWNGYQHPHCNFEELRKFFQSEYCEFLMQNSDVEPARLLEILVAELQEAIEKDAEEKAREEEERRKKMKGC